MPALAPLEPEQWGYWIDDRMPEVAELAAIFRAHALRLDPAEFIQQFREPFANARGWSSMQRTHWPNAEEGRVLGRAIEAGTAFLDALGQLPTRSRAMAAGIAHREGVNFNDASKAIAHEAMKALLVLSKVRSQVELQAKPGRPSSTRYRDVLAAHVADWIRSQTMNIPAGLAAQVSAELMAACRVLIGENPERTIAKGRRFLTLARGGN